MNSNSRIGIVVAGIVLGGFLGGIFAWLSSASSEDDDEKAIARIGPAEYFQLGIGALTFARQFQSMLQRKS